MTCTAIEPNVAASDSIQITKVWEVQIEEISGEFLQDYSVLYDVQWYRYDLFNTRTNEVSAGLNNIHIEDTDGQAAELASAEQEAEKLNKDEECNVLEKVANKAARSNEEALRL